MGESILYQLLGYTAVAFIDLLYSLITLWLKPRASQMLDKGSITGLCLLLCITLNTQK